MNKKLRLAAVMIGSSLDGVDFAVYDWAAEYSGKELVSLYAQPRYYTNFLLDQKHVDRILEIRHSRMSISADYEHDFTIDLVHALKKHVRDEWIRRSEGLVFHGPTTMHSPERFTSYQLGDAQMLSNQLGQRVMSDLRQADINAGGQGAPLMPILDAWCFNTFDGTLNLGGIANISYIRNGDWRGWDICGCNQLLDYGAGLLGMSCDKNGQRARFGTVRKDILTELEQFDYLGRRPPKSLSNEEVERYAIVNYRDQKIDPSDLLATFTKHISDEIRAVLEKLSIKKLLVTGGGAKNCFLIEALRRSCPEVQFQVPGKALVDYKECQLLSLMGILNILGEPNALATVTGAENDTIGGQWYKPEENGS